MGFLILLIVCAITAYYASVKGYNPVIWFFAAGAISLIILLILPWVNSPQNTAAERERLASNGNTVGGVLIIVGVILLIVTFPRLS